MVPGNDLANAGAVHRRVDGDEAVHLAEQAGVADHVSAVGLERAAVVVELDAGPPADEPVGDLRGLGSQPGVLAASAPAADDVVAFVELVGEHFDIVGLVLAVGVERDDDRGSGSPEAGHHRRRLAEIAGQVDDAQPGLVGCQRVEDVAGLVATAVVDHDQLERAALFG